MWLLNKMCKGPVKISVLLVFFNIIFVKNMEKYPKNLYVNVMYLVDIFLGSWYHLKRYYDDDYDLYKKRSITINEGVTVLVGCNGSGKTTLLHQIKDQLKKDGIPFVSFDNLHDGGSRAISSAGFYGDLDLWVSPCHQVKEKVLFWDYQN